MIPSAAFVVAPRAYIAFDGFDVILIHPLRRVTIVVIRLVTPVRGAFQALSGLGMLERQRPGDQSGTTEMTTFLPTRFFNPGARAEFAGRAMTTASPMLK